MTHNSIIYKTGSSRLKLLVVLTFLVVFIFFYGIAATESADVPIFTVAAGGAINYSWPIHDFKNLKVVELYLNGTTLAGTEAQFFPRVGCTYEDKKWGRFCNNSIKPYSSIKNETFNLVIMDAPTALNGATMYLKLHYANGGNASGHIQITVKKPEEKQDTTTNTRPSTTRADTTQDRTLPTSSGSAASFPWQELKQLREEKGVWRTQRHSFITAVTLLTAFGIVLLVILILVVYKQGNRAQYHLTHGQNDDETVKFSATKGSVVGISNANP